MGWFTTVYPVVLTCATGHDASARQLLDDVHDTLKAVPHYGIGYGLLRYMYAPTARLLGATRSADIFFSHVGTIPDLPSVHRTAMHRFSSTRTRRCPCARRSRALVTPSNCGCIAPAGVLHLDWWYDSRRLEPALAQSLAEGFSIALMELTREALAEDEIDLASEGMALVDLSSTDIGIGEANVQHR